MGENTNKVPIHIVGIHQYIKGYAMKKRILLMFVAIYILTSCTPSSYESDKGIDIVINKTLTEPLQPDYTIVLEAPKDIIVPRSFLGIYDSDEDILNYVKVFEGHTWEIEEIDGTIFNSEEGDVDEKICVLKKRCSEEEIPCVLFPYNEQENYPLSFEFCIEGRGSVSFMLYGDTNKNDAHVDSDNGEQNYWFELTTEGRLFYKTTYKNASYEITRSGNEETGGEPQGEPLISGGVKADTWNEICIFPLDNKLMMRFNGADIGAICEFSNEHKQMGGFSFGGSEGVMIRNIKAGNIIPPA